MARLYCKNPLFLFVTCVTVGPELGILVVGKR